MLTIYFAFATTSAINFFVDSLMSSSFAIDCNTSIGVTLKHLNVNNTNSFNSSLRLNPNVVNDFSIFVFTSATVNLYLISLPTSTHP